MTSKLFAVAFGTLALLASQAHAQVRPPHYTAAWALKRIHMVLICPDSRSDGPVVSWQVCFVDSTR